MYLFFFRQISKKNRFPAIFRLFFHDEITKKDPKKFFLINKSSENNFENFFANFGAKFRSFCSDQSFCNDQSFCGDQSFYTEMKKYRKTEC